MAGGLTAKGGVGGYLSLGAVGGVIGVLAGGALAVPGGALAGIGSAWTFITGRADLLGPKDTGGPLGSGVGQGAAGKLEGGAVDSTAVVVWKETWFVLGVGDTVIVVGGNASGGLVGMLVKKAG